MKDTWIWPLFFFFFLYSCKQEQKPCELDEEILAVRPTLTIERLEDAFFEAADQAEILYLLEAHPLFAEKYLLVNSYASKEELAEELWIIHQDSIMVELYEEVKNEYPNIDSLREELENAFAHISYYFPEFKIPKIYTFVSGFSSDIVVTEDIIVIGLDYYLPPTHRFQPPDLPQYISKRYDRDYIVPNIVTAISSFFNETDLNQNSLLAEMIFYGKAYHFTKSILPCTSDAFIIGYTPEEIAACWANEEFVWAHFVENELFFETNPFEIRKYTGEAPFTDEISPDAPGRIGRWLGWNIVDDYRFNHTLSLRDLMKESDKNKIFRQSGYKPRR
ncbi:gliding motility lipoprotein GldB [Mongoliitalea daihaiensis]|uniref:gliding motility lipoprotein GldB n=1 Tax=Mongoliitalea daihaiensis TaxID=2782006 RepID=UPI001F39C831|nr:gliding motility lipoprotein GldB [Mongoliitalea daihaiensis]UJP65988.1 gliding motility lipoprotein GldB [Mongoliitalea daihaiensis]